MNEIDPVHLSSFYESIPERHGKTAREIADAFAYFLQVELGLESFKATDILECFRLSDLSVPTWIAAYLTNSTKAKPPGYVKAKPGYRLHASRREVVAKSIGNKPSVIHKSTPLSAIHKDLPAGMQKDFLREAIDCYVAGCNRAAIVLFWSFILDHLFEVVLKKHLAAFNAKVAAHPEKRISAITISARDDFSDLPEGKFIELLRSSGIISNDVRKILDQKLGIRNSAAHPSTVIFKQAKANEFFDDLLDNVFLKYPV